MSDETTDPTDPTENSEAEVTDTDQPEERMQRTGSGPRWCEAPNAEENEAGDLDAVDLVQKLNRTVDEIEQSQDEKNRREWMAYDLELYTGDRVTDLDAASEVFARIDAREGNGQIFNKAYQLVGTVRNRICSFRPRAQFVPSSGNGKAKRASRYMTELSDAWADHVGYQKEASLKMRDQLTCDLGWMKVYVEDGDTKLARFPPWEQLWDKEDGKLGDPECRYHVRRIPTVAAAAMLGVDPEELAGQSSSNGSLMAGAIGASNALQKVRVIDAYQRGPNGRHVIVVGNKLHTDEDWHYDGIPFITGVFDEKHVGVSGHSVVSLTRAAQVELNEQQITLREAHHQSATKIIHTKKGENAPTGLNNAYVAVDEYVNTAATVETPPALHPEAYQYTHELEGQMSDTIGLSPNTMRGQGRAGVTAAVAIREDTELQADRLALPSQNWETDRVETAKWWWRLTRDHAKKNPDAKPKWRAISRGVWKEMVFEDLTGEYEIRVLPSSLFGQSLSGQFQKAADLIKEGWLTREQAMSALNVPDISPITDLILSEQMLQEKIVDDILEDEHYETPDEYMNKEALFTYARARYFLALLDDAYSEEAMNMLRRLLNATKPQPAAPPAGPPAPGGPGGGGPQLQPPVLPGIAPPTSAGPTPTGEPPQAPPGPALPPVPGGPGGPPVPGMVQ